MEHAGSYPAAREQRELLRDDIGPEHYPAVGHGGGIGAQAEHPHALGHRLCLRVVRGGVARADHDAIEARSAAELLREKILSPTEREGGGQKQ